MLALPGVASAKTYTVNNTEEFEQAVKQTNADASVEANTIAIGNEAYIPAKTLAFTNTKDPLTIEGPAGSPTVKTASQPTITGSG